MRVFSSMVFKGGVTAALAGILWALPANAIPFDVTAATFTVGGGYGIDINEASGTKLNVQFSTAAFATQNFDLSAPGQFVTFTFGTVNLQEADAHSGIKAAETDGLGIIANFTIPNPLGSNSNISTIGTAFTGAVSDSHVDYTLVWEPIIVDFGTTGQFSIDLLDLSFTTRGAQSLIATITLLGLDGVENPEVVGVPEPTTLLLFLFALVGLAAASSRTARRNKIEV
jgi:hypothetical protein